MIANQTFLLSKDQMTQKLAVIGHHIIFSNEQNYPTLDWTSSWASDKTMVYGRKAYFLYILWFLFWCLLYKNTSTATEI